MHNRSRQPASERAPSPLGDLLLEMRTRSGLSQKALADQMGVAGVDQTVVSCLERGSPKRKVTFPIFVAWHQVCGGTDDEMRQGLAELAGRPVVVPAGMGA